MPVSGTDTAAFKNNTAPVTADSNMAATTSNKPSNKYPVNTVNSKNAHKVEKIAAENKAGKPIDLRAVTRADAATIDKAKGSKGTAENQVITAGVSHPSQQNNNSKNKQ